MRLKPAAWIAAIAGIAATLVAGLAAPAWAARGDVYSVSDVAVDVTSQDSARAREMGFAQAQQLAFARLVKRLTIPDELTRLGAPTPTERELDAVVDGVDIQQEQRSGVRYLARLGVNFDKNGVIRILKSKGLTVADTRSAPLLIVPVLLNGAPENLLSWRNAWTQGGFAEELVPLAIAPDGGWSTPDWATAQPHAAFAGAAAALYVTAAIEGANLRVSLREVTAAGVREMGELSTPWPATSPDNGASLFVAMATAVSDRVQNEWKASLAAGAMAKARIAATASFASIAQWLQIKRGLAQATQTLVSDIQIEQVAADGAVLSFSHLGQPAQLTAELGRYGVVYEAKGQTATLRAVAAPQ